jgi:hypothetical protein
VYGLAVIAMTEILHHWLPSQPYLHGPAGTLNCHVHYGHRTVDPASEPFNDRAAYIAIPRRLAYSSPSRLRGEPPVRGKEPSSALSRAINIQRSSCDSGAVEFIDFHRGKAADSAKLADAQFALARSYGFKSWARLKTFVEAQSRSPEELGVLLGRRSRVLRPPVSRLRECELRPCGLSKIWRQPASP